MALNDIVLFHRNPAQEILAVRPFTRLEWARRFVGGGVFRLDLPLEQGAAVACGDILDVELDGRSEFTGIVQHRSLSYRPQRSPLWRLEGVDLSWWLHQRVIIPPAGQSHDEQLGVAAESAIRHYVDAHLLNPSDPERVIPVVATLAPANSPLLGPTVSLRARYSNLGKEVERIALRAGIGLRVERDAAGAISVAVVAERDRTAASGHPVIFSPALGTVETLTYTEAGVRNRNAIVVLGSGSGAGRLVETVTDPTDVAARGRRELALDARTATTSAAATDAGEAELAGQAADRRRVEARPARAGPQTYRIDWDVGDVVTLDLPDIGQRFDQRIETVRCEIDGETPLSITCAFGAPTPDATDTLRRLDERSTPGRFI